MAKILIVGNGGRENAIKRALGAHEIAQTTSSNMQEILRTAQEFAADLTIVGSEDLLVAGIGDLFSQAGMKLFGPGKAAARLEGSKAYAKDFMKKYGVKTASYQTFSDYETAIAGLVDFNLPVVVKASGLAAGKGVIICETADEARDAIAEIMVEGRFGKAGEQVILEEYLVGKEASILTLANEKGIFPLVSAKDHKKIGEGETGPNTGGMGTFAPNPFYTDERQAQFERDILAPTLKGIQAEGLKFAGCIFFGLMLTDNGTYLLEYNMRFGDPETQVVLPLLDSDLYSLLTACMQRTLTQDDIQIRDQKAICLVLASGGYPGSYEKGKEITGLEGVDYLEAGVRHENGKVYTNGGRVLNLVARADTLAAARQVVYENAQKVDFAGKTYRKDIGSDAI
ncbi:phosphoribosylamine--glycine ligase [Varibaculum cambriense]|uniref:phosphoribosylamine--glycine ligase n=1 Tax=Varibaculum cambriense TaxID=184870 RepID=UPI002906675F|nr:phosphoribosylamine--glycine ligase [Varibaculum cambriense]MDU5542096.1 phosphoribosylamine--glycine ligase [Varibaculum cambriense]